MFELFYTLFISYIHVLISGFDAFLKKLQVTCMRIKEQTFNLKGGFNLFLVVYINPHIHMI